MFQVNAIGILGLVTVAAIPNSENTPEYALYREMPKERTLLNHLRDSLGISPIDAETLERELQGV